jgi:hypothetical protein
MAMQRIVARKRWCEPNGLTEVAPTPADAAAMAASDVDDAGTLAAAGESVEGVPAELANPPHGGTPSQVETDADTRNSLG